MSPASRPGLTRRACALGGLGALGTAGLGAAATGAAAGARPLRAVGTQFARLYEGAEGRPPQGLAVDLLHQLFGAGVQCERMPWARALLLVEVGEADILVGPYLTVDRETRLRFSARSFYSDPMVWYARNGETSRWRGDYEDLRRARVAAVRGWAYGSRFDRMKWLTDDISWVTSVEAGLQMLARGRVDLFAGNERNCRPVLERLGLAGAIARCQPPLDVLHGHMAFSRSPTGEALAQRYDQAFEAWSRRPGAAELYRRWGVDKPPGLR
ncbi:MAG: ABC transporter substrate-binding protein [Roseateles depolymerans]|uniref:ABC transporter substrate-binding protein n=1 Tax=Roseateles depolymerans TaxID=76731 RepID=A0A2W5FVU1_9BURK|nr:MAG: ABC transporter substrate-binding protein [Roseateles depolymerans]